MGYDDFFDQSPTDEMVDQIFPSLSGGGDFEPAAGGKKRRRGSSFGGMYGRLAPGAGGGLPFMAPYVPGVSGMRMVGTGGMPSFGGLTTQQMFGGGGNPFAGVDTSFLN